MQRLLAKERYKANKTKNASKLRRHELRTATGFVRLSFGIGNPWALGRHGALVWPLTVASAILCSLSRCLVCNILRNPSLAPLITFQGSPGSDSLHCRFRRDLREDLSASIGAKRLCAFQGDTSWLKLEYQGAIFRRLGQQHVGVHCSKAFRDEHPAFVKVLAWALDKAGWRKLKETSLVKKKSIILLAVRDPDAKQLMSKSWKTFVDKSASVQYLTAKCEVKEKSFLVASAL